MSAYHHNYRAFGKLVLQSPAMVAEMRKRAERIKERAEATAPDAPPYGEGYKYRFSVSSGIRKGKTTRAYGRVTNDDPAARFIEFGTEDTPRHRTLGKAMDAGN
jgi:hypothetical protein